VAVLVNTSPDQVELRLATTGQASYGSRAAAAEQAIAQLTLPPFEVEVLTRLS
jgi:hypothetical protein